LGKPPAQIKPSVRISTRDVVIVQNWQQQVLAFTANGLSHNDQSLVNVQRLDWIAHRGGNFLSPVVLIHVSQSASAHFSFISRALFFPLGLYCLSLADHRRPI
jgi:hypothetical protein